MRSIVISINPVIFRLGSLELRWYTVAIVVALLVALIIAIKEGKRKGIQADQIYSLRRKWSIANFEEASYSRC